MNAKSLCILSAVLANIFGAPTNSPCPSVFMYEPAGNQTDRWFGEITISSDVMLTGILIGIVLDRKAHLLGNYLGESYTSDNQEYMILEKKIKIKPGEIKRIRFFVKYNEAETIPELQTIRLNGKDICASQSRIITTDQPRPITAKPTVLIPSQKPTEDIVAGMDYFDGDAAFSALLTNANTVKVQSCGVVSTKVVPLIAGAERTSRGDWPWHAALYQTRGTDLAYICGGSLISKTAIVTAAHCVSRTFSRGKVDPQSLLVFLGKHNLRRWFPEEQSIQISDIIIHPDYNSANYQADVAILKFESPVTFNNFVKPICLWDSRNTDLESIVNKIGTVVGWGYDESGQVTEELGLAEMPIIEQETCVYSNREFFSKFSNKNSYCAGFRNGTSVCNGDSGGGMYFSFPTSGGVNQWKLRGLVSLSVSQGNDTLCNVNSYVVFTDLSKYITWIQQNII